MRVLQDETALYFRSPLGLSRTVAEKQHLASRRDAGEISFRILAQSQHFVKVTERFSEYPCENQSLRLTEALRVCYNGTKRLADSGCPENQSGRAGVSLGALAFSISWYHCIKSRWPVKVAKGSHIVRSSIPRGP